MRFGPARARAEVSCLPGPHLLGRFLATPYRAIYNEPPDGWGEHLMALQPSAAGEGSVGAVVAQCRKYFTWDDATDPDPTDYYSYCPTSWPILRFVGDRLLPGKTVG